VKGEFGSQLFSNFNSGVRIVQTITVSDEKKTRVSRLGSKENRREFKEGEKVFKMESPKAESYSETILNNLYDSIDKPVTTAFVSPTEILLDRSKSSPTQLPTNWTATTTCWTSTTTTSWTVRVVTSVWVNLIWPCCVSTGWSDSVPISPLSTLSYIVL
jgi:hypothetical protein